MSGTLVFVHGRAQQDKNADELKQDWIGALRHGLAKSGLDLPIAPDAVRFPYYGNTLRDLVDFPTVQAAEVLVHGEGLSDDEQAFMRSVVLEMAAHEGITDRDVLAASGPRVIEQGPLNWGWIQAVLEAMDKVVPGASAASIALFTNDVYHYLRNPGIRDDIETGVRKAMDASAPAVVVGHSLGSVVAYNLLRREGKSSGWQVPLFVTVGSPLGISEIRRSLRPIGHPPCVGQWFNAMDDRDVVSLFPLDANHFGITPSVENKTDVMNSTPNRHGISGYLDDQVVARRIHDALVG